MVLSRSLNSTYFASLRGCSPACMRAIFASVQFCFFLRKNRNLHNVGRENPITKLECSVPTFYGVIRFLRSSQGFSNWFHYRESIQSLVHRPNLPDAPKCSRNTRGTASKGYQGERFQKLTKSEMNILGWD